MGSRRGADFGKYSGTSAWHVKPLGEAIETKSAHITVATAIDLMALASPQIATLVTAYHIGKTVHGIVQKSYEAYERTGDSGEALAAGVKEAVNAGVSSVKSHAIDSTVDMAWGAIKVSAGVTTSQLEDKVLSSAVKNTIEEVLPHGKAKH